MYKYTYNQHERDEKEIEKVIKRVPGWLSKGYTQINSVILLKFLELTKEKNAISLPDLEEECSQLIDKGKFNSNFTQMKNFGKKNHGKVFETKNDEIFLWKPVAEFILTKYEKIKNSTDSY